MSDKQYNVCVLQGDGIGPEIIQAAVKVAAKVAELEGFTINWSEHLFGGAAYDVCSEMFPQETLAACKAADAVLLGAVGGPKWDKLEGAKRPEAALLKIRKELGLYANLRPAKLYSSLADACPLKDEYTKNGMDILFVRELTGGIYFGERGSGFTGSDEFAFDTEKYSVSEIERVARIAFDAAMHRNKKVCSVDKANVLESSRLWRSTVVSVAAEYPEVELEHLYVDNASMQLLRRPGAFDVILCSNMFGDILSDEAAEITGSIGLLPSASMGLAGTTALYEPIHGSAPDLAGLNKANPLATILSVAMMFRYSLNREDAAVRIEQAVETLLNDGYRCADIYTAGKDDEAKLLSCSDMGERLISYL